MLGLYIEVQTTHRSRRLARLRILRNPSLTFQRVMIVQNTQKMFLRMQGRYVSLDRAACDMVVDRPSSGTLPLAKWIRQSWRSLPNVHGRIVRLLAQRTTRKGLNPLPPRVVIRDLISWRDQSQGGIEPTAAPGHPRRSVRGTTL